MSWVWLLWAGNEYVLLDCWFNLPHYFWTFRNITPCVFLWVENTALSESAEQQVVEICDKPITNPYIPTELISEADQTQTRTQIDLWSERVYLCCGMDRQADIYFCFSMTWINTITCRFLPTPIQHCSKFKRSRNPLHKHFFTRSSELNNWKVVFSSLKLFSVSFYKIK